MPGSRYGFTNTIFVPFFLARCRYFVLTGWSFAGLDPKNTIKSVPIQSL
jgi:hypothetical protein